MQVEKADISLLHTDFEESQAHENFSLFTVQECIIRSVVGTCVSEGLKAPKNFIRFRINPLVQIGFKVAGFPRQKYQSQGLNCDRGIFAVPFY